MKLPQNNPLTDYRDNLILCAILQVDTIQHLGKASPWLSDALLPIENAESLVSLINDLAYNAIAQTVPSVVVEVVQDELREMPISINEIQDVLARPVSQAVALDVLLR